MHEPAVDRKYAYFCGGLSAVAYLLFISARYLILQPLGTGSSTDSVGTIFLFIYLILLPGFGAAVAITIGTNIRQRLLKKSIEPSVADQIVARQTVKIFTVILAVLLALGFKNIFDQKIAKAATQNSTP